MVPLFSLSSTPQASAAGPLKSKILSVLFIALAGGWGPLNAFEPHSPQTTVAIKEGLWQINGTITYPGSACEGLLMNVRMVNATFEDRNDATHPKGFSADANTDRFLAKLTDYRKHGILAITLCLQGGMPGYEGAINSAFNREGALDANYMQRVRRVISACDREGLVVILGCYYQRQSSILKDDDALRSGIVNVANWIHEQGFRNVVLEVINEFGHRKFAHQLLRSAAGTAELIQLARSAQPSLLVSASGYGHGRLAPDVLESCDFLLPHFNVIELEEIPSRIEALKPFGKPIVCNEDDRTGEQAAKAAELCVAAGVSYGAMFAKTNQNFGDNGQPFRFEGAADDPIFYARLKELTTPVGKAVAARLLFEAESAVAAENYDRVEREGASGGVAMRASEEEGAKLHFDIVVPEAGRWELSIRAFCEGHTNNGLFVEVDGQRRVAPPSHLHAGQDAVYLIKERWAWTSSWYAMKKHVTKHEGPVTLDLTAGAHRLTLVKRRRERPFIDQIRITRIVDQSE